MSVADPSSPIDAHDIVSITTSNGMSQRLGFDFKAELTSNSIVVYHAPPPTSNKPPPRAIPGGAFFSFIAGLLKWVVLIAIVVGAIVAYRAYSLKKTQKRF